MTGTTVKTTAAGTTVEYVEVTTTLDNVPVSLRDRIEAKYAKLAKRLARYDAPGPTVEFGPVEVRTFEDEDGRERSYNVFTTVTVTGHTVRLAGWYPVVALDHTVADDEALLAFFPDYRENEEAKADARARFAHRGPVCDHCGKSRNRNTTVVFVNDDGDFTEVGTSCILDYLGIDPRTLLMLVESDDDDFDDDDFEGARGASTFVSPAEFLAVAAELTRVNGFTPTHSENPYAISTRDAVGTYLNGNRHVKEAMLPDFDGDRAAAAVEAITGWLATEVETDFIASARLAVRASAVHRKTEGLLACLPFVFAKATTERIEREAYVKPTGFVGAVGEKVTGTGVVSVALAVRTEFGTSIRFTVLTDDGKALTTFGSGSSLFNFEAGDRVTITGTVKALETTDKYGDQTALTRCKVVEATGKETD